MKAKILASALLLFAALIIFATGSALAQKMGQTAKPKVIELKATKATTRGEGTDPNIKSDNETNDPNADVPAPEAKGGPKTRGGGACEVRFDNRTKLIIKVYVDGIFRGTIGPWGDGIVYTLPGETRVYARAEFTDGSSLYWGPTNYDCLPGQYINFKMVP